MSDSVGRLFRPIVIDVDVKDAVNQILRAPAPDSPEVFAARRTIVEKAPPHKAYLYAAEVRAYLEEKTRVGTEDRVFPIAGDLFLDALEANLASIGPNFFKDHYTGIAGCYRNGDEPTKAVEGPLYCAELAIQRALQVYLTGDGGGPATPAVRVAFLRDDAPDPRVRMNQFLELGERALHDAVDRAAAARPGQLPPPLIELVGVYRERLERILAQAREEPTNPRPPDMEYLEAWQDKAVELGYPPLMALVREEMGRLCERNYQQTQDPEDWKAYVHRTYEAGELCMRQGNRERESRAWNLSMRRHNRAARLFEAIQDRTSAAKALVEKARAFIAAGREGEVIRDSLHKAVCLVVAHRDDLPQGRLPKLSDEQVCWFLETKGYTIEASAYRASLAR